MHDSGSFGKKRLFSPVWIHLPSRQLPKTKFRCRPLSSLLILKIVYSTCPTSYCLFFSSTQWISNKNPWFHRNFGFMFYSWSTIYWPFVTMMTILITWKSIKNSLDPRFLRWILNGSLRFWLFIGMNEFSWKWELFRPKTFGTENWQKWS